MISIKQNIIYLKHHEIDKAKWDECINNSLNGNIYAYSFYLDTMSKHWDALVMDDYKIVMPLTWNKKYGIYYLYQPFFTASLGVFGNNLSAQIVKSFLENIPAKFKYWDIYLNRDNLFFIPGFKIYQRRNYVLKLNDSYKNLTLSFSQNHLRNIKKAEQFGYFIEKNISVKSVIELSKRSEKISSVTDDDYKKFSNLYSILCSQNKAIAYGVFNKQKQLLASCIYFFSLNRAYYILAGNHPDGRKSGASHFLINAFIKDHTGENLVLDFEGSEVITLANFYKKFGAKEENYAAVKMNMLPGILKLFKK